MIRYTQMFGKEWKHDHKNFAERKVNMDRNAPIGVFDSGIGGLTVAREIMRQMPQERIVYFGDTARVPYGSKSQETVLRYSRQIIRFLKTQGVKAIVIACNTASACALETVRQELDIPIIGVIYAGARTAAEATHNGKIGVIGTEATIRSGIYTREMQKLRPDIEVIGKPCPLFVPLVEEGLFHDSVTDEIASRYLSSLKEKYIDTLVLGCTHFVFYRDYFRELLPERAAVIDGNEGTVRHLGVVLESLGKLAPEDATGGVELANSDPSERIAELSRKLLNV